MAKDYSSIPFKNRDIDRIKKKNKKRRLNTRALNIEDRATYNEAQGGRKYNKATKMYKRSDRLKAKAKKL